MSYETKANPKKKEAVTRLEETFDRADGIIFTDFTGLSVAKVNELRTKFFEAGEVDYVVAKNTLIRLALGKKGLDKESESLDSVLSGPTGMAIGYDDSVKPVKIIADFAKEHGKPVFKGGIVDGDYYSPEEIDRLKNLPPMEVLYAQVVGGIANPLGGFVGVLNETVRSFVGVIDAIIEKKKTEEGAAA